MHAQHVHHRRGPLAVLLHGPVGELSELQDARLAVREHAEAVDVLRGHVVGVAGEGGGGLVVLARLGEEQEGLALRRGDDGRRRPQGFAHRGVAHVGSNLLGREGCAMTGERPWNLFVNKRLRVCWTTAAAQQCEGESSLGGGGSAPGRA